MVSPLDSVLLKLVTDVQSASPSVSWKHTMPKADRWGDTSPTRRQRNVNRCIESHILFGYGNNPGSLPRLSCYTMSTNSEKSGHKQCFVQFVRLLTDNLHDTLDFHQNTNVQSVQNEGSGFFSFLLLMKGSFIQKFLASRTQRSWQDSDFCLARNSGWLCRSASLVAVEAMKPCMRSLHRPSRNCGD